MSDLVRWRCKCGAVLGVVKRTPAKVRTLVVVSTAVAGKNPTEQQLQVAADRSRVWVRGDAVVACEFCGRRKRWSPAAHGMEEIVARMKAKG